MQLLVLLSGVILLSLAAAPWARGLVDRVVNRVARQRRAVTDRARALHSRLWIADLHSDALLWGRDLLVRHARGHVDVPRLSEGGVALQVFAATNAFPVTANYRRTPHGPDLISLVAVANRWPLAAWRSPLHRALAQAEALRAAAARSGGALVLIETAQDLRRLAAGPAAPRGAVLLLEGMHGLGRDETALDALFAAGYRIFGVAHMTDNAVGGSAHGWRKGGLTELGRRVIARLDAMGAIIDLAHASAQTVDDVLGLVTRPVLVSHTGVIATCPGNRNLSDAQLESIAGAGGLVGIAFFARAVCGPDPASIGRAIRHAVSRVGAERVALGSDWDGAVRVPFDSAHLAELTQALLDEGFSEDDIGRVMGLNARRFLTDHLPPAGA